jgi:hypothetical protein
LMALLTTGILKQIPLAYRMEQNDTHLDN